MRAGFTSVIATLTLSFLLGLSCPSYAGYAEDIGFIKLQSELGNNMPDGSGVAVTQTEARTSYGTPLGPYMPDITDPQFSGKTITKKTADNATGSSGHATGVGELFYGNTSSLSHGILNIDAYEALNWLQGGFLNYGSLYQGRPIQPFYMWPTVMSSPSRIANHSWVSDGAVSDILRRLDFVADRDEFIQVVAPDNGTSNKPLLISAYNSISVGRSDGIHQRGSVFVDEVYNSGRTKPDIAVPVSVTSSAAPIASSAISLLVETGSDPDLSTDPESQYTTIRSGTQIYNATHSEVIKAALMAGADRVTHNGSFTNITDYRVAPANQSPNGLDIRFGAGQLNVYNSYHIIAAGEQNSAEDYPSGQGNIGVYGFDFDPSFGGSSGSNISASYYFTADQGHRMLYASLVWNIKIDGGTWDNFNNAATLYNLELYLYDVTDQAHPRFIIGSSGANDNTENIWVPLSPGRKYMLQVVPASGQQPFKWHYALAWRMTTPPDSDGDGIPDDWEVFYGLNYLDPSDGVIDSDGDGLSNADEFRLGTDPKNRDTDGDGYTDGQEVAYGSNPLDAQSMPAVAVPAFTKTAYFIGVILLLGLALRTN